MASLGACVVALGVGCGPSAPSSAPPPSRVQAVAAAPVADPLADFCEERPSRDAAPTFAWPPLDEAPPEWEGGWTWVNVWATWCGPCVEELPLIVGWEAPLRQALGPGAVRFLTVDADPAAVAGFRVKHPSTPPSSRLRDEAGLQPFLASLGLDRSAALPLQVFLDGEHRVRCVRVGAVGERDLSAVKAALGG